MYNSGIFIWLYLYLSVIFLSVRIFYSAGMLNTFVFIFKVWYTFYFGILLSFVPLKLADFSTPDPKLFGFNLTEKLVDFCGLHLVNFSQTFTVLNP